MTAKLGARVQCDELLKRIACVRVLMKEYLDSAISTELL